MKCSARGELELHVEKCVWPFAQLLPMMRWTSFITFYSSLLHHQKVHHGSSVHHFGWWTLVHRDEQWWNSSKFISFGELSRCDGFFFLLMNFQKLWWIVFQHFWKFIKNSSKFIKIHQYKDNIHHARTAFSQQRVRKWSIFKIRTHLDTVHASEMTSNERGIISFQIRNEP